MGSCHATLAERLDQYGDRRSLAGHGVRSRGMRAVRSALARDRRDVDVCELHERPRHGLVAAEPPARNRIWSPTGSHSAAPRAYTAASTLTEPSCQRPTDGT